MKKKGLIFLVPGIVLALNCLIITGTAFGKSNNEFSSGEDFKCKWTTETCPNNVNREVCLRDGTGNDCTCGDVTRSC